MLKIRLARRGKKRQPTYRVVVAESTSKRDGRFVEQIGHYDPMVNPEGILIHEDRALHWLSVGAQPTDAVRRMLEKQGTYDRLKRLHAGEVYGALVAEYQGLPWPPPAVEEPTPAPKKVKEVVAPVVEVVEEVADPVVEEVVEEVVSAPVAETVVDTVEEVVSAEGGSDTEAEVEAETEA